ncbi:uncharacterized protein PFL1_04538 [Pseudozyma flocculosa PF-1]|uniref:BHLH domain-containing protein n=1 Tax=Pseudozyma flocculosa PF-1 TaxID=1277687 RepID=A0A061H568_9BASI|nr:uncharacterized protein PFL1_04538 [Pseudozyma flocculosa PF-1]EPQ27793.1 hypothetical protein PFL1_04538 [Pseudozyma flocculosa PF-1]
MADAAPLCRLAPPAKGWTQRRPQPAAFPRPSRLATAEPRRARPTSSRIARDVGCHEPSHLALAPLTLAPGRPEGTQLGKRPMDEADDDLYRPLPRAHAVSPRRTNALQYSYRDAPESEDTYRGPGMPRRPIEKNGAPSLAPEEDRYWPRPVENSPDPRFSGPPLPTGDEGFEHSRSGRASYPGRLSEGDGYPPRPRDDGILARDRSGPWRDWEGPAPHATQHRFGASYPSDFHHGAKSERRDGEPGFGPEDRRRGTIGAFPEGLAPGGPGYGAQAVRSPVPPFASPRDFHPGPPPPRSGFPAGREGPPPGPSGATMPLAPPLARPASTVGLMSVPGSASAGPVPAPTPAAAAATPSANRRVAHLLSEQRRRESINTGFEDLRQTLPACRDGQDSKATVLRRAVEYIHELESIIQQTHRMRANSGGVDFDSRSPPRDHDPYGGHHHPGRPDHDPRGNPGPRGGGSSRRDTASSGHSDDRTMINGVPGHSYRRDMEAYRAGPTQPLPPSPLGRVPGGPEYDPMAAPAPYDGWTADPGRQPGHFAAPHEDTRHGQLGLKRSNSDPEESEAVARVRRKLGEVDGTPQHSPSGSPQIRSPATASSTSRRSEYRLQREGGDAIAAPRSAEAGGETNSSSNGASIRLRTGLGIEAAQRAEDGSSHSAVPRRASNSIFIERRPT